MDKAYFEVADSVFVYEFHGASLYIGYPSSVDIFSGYYKDWDKTYESEIAGVEEFFSRGLNRW